MTLPSVVLVFIALFCLATVAPAPKAVKKKFPDYYPLTQDSTWVYHMGSSEVTV
jgi:hypothetical protein